MSESFIAGLVDDARPVRRARAPLARAAAWLLQAGVVLAALAAAQGVRPDLAARLAEPGYCAGVAAALATALLAALAAFTLSLPDRSRAWALLPLPGLAAWTGCLGLGCLRHWVPLAAAVVEPGEPAGCFVTVLACAAPLNLALFWMLRRAARLRPVAAVLCGALAVSAAAATGLAVLHRIDASAMVLAWNFGVVATLLLADAAAARLLFRR